ncbi:50S ribosomal protein L19 [Candidatus Gracilibacteria bacterium]|nr:50S ribosomal protein L19 [Candidatus Gracilibacteria bacterium]
MDQLLKKISLKSCKSSIPVLRPGYQVRVHQKITEGNKERVQVFQGMVIATGSGEGVGQTFTVRKISEGIGVEKVFPIHAPSIVKIEVQRAHKVRRAKLHFLRDLSGKALRLKEVSFKLVEKEFDTKNPELEAVVVETEEEPAQEVKEETTKEEEKKEN